MKKILALVICVMFVALSCVSVSAAVTADTHKDSYQTYAGQGKLKVKTEAVYGFENKDEIFVSNGDTYLDYSDCKEGEASFVSKLHVGSVTVLETKTGVFSTGINDVKKETLKFWFYVNDIDLMHCDHDSVYQNAQKGSGTINVEFAETDYVPHKYKIQHTFEGSGWHLIEIALNTHNLPYDDWKNIDLTKIGWMRITSNVKEGCIVKVDGLTKYTYSNDGYVQPECPDNGRWISTCDFDALDGPILSEWYASSFDLNEKTQGSSSLSLTAHLEHVDFRAVWGGINLPIKEKNEVFHVDVYISDMKAIGSSLEVRLSHCESGSSGTAVYSFNYGTANTYANDRTGLKQGWNSLDIPVMAMKLSYDKTYYKDGLDFVLDHIVFFWTGASRDQEYTVKYDNMYLYQRDVVLADPNAGSTGFGMSDSALAQVATDIKDKKVTEVSRYSAADVEKIKTKFAELYPDIELAIAEDGTVTLTEKSNDDLIMYLAIGGIALVAIIFIVIIVVVVSKRKKASAPAAPVTVKAEETSKEEENK